MSTETIRLISDGEKGVGMAVGEEGETENIIHMTFSKKKNLITPTILAAICHVWRIYVHF